MVCALKRRREIDKLGRESVIGIMVLSLVGPKDQKQQKSKYYRKFRVTLMLHHRVRTQRVSTQRVSTLKRNNSNQKSKLRKSNGKKVKDKKSQQSKKNLALTIRTLKSSHYLLCLQK